MKVFDNHVLVTVTRKGTEQTVPFYQLRAGDRVIDQEGQEVVIKSNAKLSNSPDYEGWFVYGTNKVCYYPKDFGAEAVRMKYAINIKKAAADYEKHQEQRKKLSNTNILIQGFSALCIAMMALVIIFNGPEIMLSKWLILMGFSVLATYIMTGMMITTGMNVNFYKMTSGCKLVNMYTIPLSQKSPFENLFIVVEGINGNIKKYQIGKVKRVGSAKCGTPVVNMDHEHLYIPCDKVNMKPEKIEDAEVDEYIVDVIAYDD